MKSLKYTAAIVILASLATPAMAAEQGGLLLPSYGGMRGTGSVHMLDTNRPLSAPAVNPTQAQMQDDYATQLRQEQHDLLQRNPSGTTRQELTIGGQLNGFTPR